MGSISSWIISIACVSLFSVLIEHLMPSGEISKYIRIVVAMVIVYVVVSPIGNIFGSDSIKELVVSSVPVESDIMYSINKSKAKRLDDDITKALVDSGYKGVQVEVNADLFSDSFDIINILVDFSNVVLIENNANID